jgi:hypothetical protein
MPAGTEKGMGANHAPNVSEPGMDVAYLAQKNRAGNRSANPTMPPSRSAHAHFIAAISKSWIE